jgi:DNA-binding NtrC family response regulator
MSRSPASNPIAIVVDDDFLIRMDAVSILEEAGFDTRDAENGDRGLALVEEAHGEVELLFTDVQMPGEMNGFALAREVAHRWPHIGIVVASGAMKPGRGDMPDGATFIAKPFSADLVHDHLTKVLPEHRQPQPLRAHRKLGRPS